MNRMNSGYVGWSMSKRAARAYDEGEKPRSKWTKTAMLEAIGDYAYEEEIEVDFAALLKMRKDEVFERFFRWSSWHHTSKYCNQTDFYALDGERLEEWAKGVSA